MKESAQPLDQAEAAPTARTDASVELRTPVNHVIGICEMLLEDGSVAPSFRPDLERIHQAGERLLHLIREFFKDADTHDEALRRRQIHDLRTPINHIVGYSEILAEDAGGPEHEQFRLDLQKIRTVADDWLGLLEDHVAESETREGTQSQGESLLRQLADAASHHSGGDSSEIPTIQTGRILVVDDDELNRDILSRRLSKDGQDVEIAVDGDSALAFLKKQPFDLVLLDMIMPGRNGVDVLIEMKKDAKLKDIPVIVISALDDQDGIARCIELGAEDYLAKPFNPAVLRARIGTSLEKHRLREIEKRHLASILEERRRSERLLLNILPEAVADRLKRGEDEIADHFAEVTVLFADLVDFTVLSASNQPREIVGMLNRIFSTFDSVASRHGLEKIKTIGDAYMAVGGLPEPQEHHAEAMASFALELIDEVEQINRDNGTEINIRIGIDTGPVIAGIIGLNKFIYDLWGDTVNTASRMESHGEPGRIQVTERTRNKLAGERFNLVERGEIQVKGKGSMRTWFLERASG